MTNRTVVIKRKTFGGQQKTKRKIQAIVETRAYSAGFINPVFVVLACTVFSGLFYIFLVNQTAVKGIAIRNAEKEIESQKKNNELLKIKEAELKSLYRIEEQSKQMNMIDSEGVTYIEESPSVAFSDVKKENKIK